MPNLVKIEQNRWSPFSNMYPYNFEFWKKLYRFKLCSFMGMMTNTHQPLLLNQESSKALVLRPQLEKALERFASPAHTSTSGARFVKRRLDKWINIFIWQHGSVLIHQILPLSKVHNPGPRFHVAPVFCSAGSKYIATELDSFCLEAVVLQSTTLWA